MALITTADFADYKDISSNIDSAARVDPYILNAERLDLKPLLGERFFADLIANPNTTANALLLDGGDYTYNSNDYNFAGLKAVLVYYSYARFLENQNVNVTRFGVVHKNNPDVSERVDDKTLMRHVSNAREIAKSYFAEVDLFIIRNSTDYPLYHKCYAYNESAGAGVRITAVGDKAYQRTGAANWFCERHGRYNCSCYYN